MTIQEIVWDEDSILHIARHGVDPEEAEQVCFSGEPSIWKAKRQRYIALGCTQSGRYLTVVFEYLGKKTARIITARAMSEAERKLYRKR